MKNNLTEEDLHQLVIAKMKEPGLTISDIYVSLSQIHPKPNSLFWILVFIWIAILPFLLFAKSLPWFCLLLILQLILSVVIICVQSKHDISPVPSSLMTGIATLVAYVVLEYSNVGGDKSIKELINDLLSLL